jgi:hypothetical protein
VAFKLLHLFGREDWGIPFVGNTVPKVFGQQNAFSGTQIGKIKGT